MASELKKKGSLTMIVVLLDVIIERFSCRIIVGKFSGPTMVVMDTRSS